MHSSLSSSLSSKWTILFFSLKKKFVCVFLSCVVCFYAIMCVLNGIMLYSGCDILYCFEEIKKVKLEVIDVTCLSTSLNYIQGVLKVLLLLPLRVKDFTKQYVTKGCQYLDETISLSYTTRYNRLDICIYICGRK